MHGENLKLKLVVECLRFFEQVDLWNQSE